MCSGASLIVIQVFDLNINRLQTEGLAIYPSNAMTEAIGNADKSLPVGYREKSLVCFSVDSVDATCKELLAKGIEFINMPIDMPGWGGRVVHLRDPEGNLIELFSPLSTEQWDKELIEENKKYQ